MHNSVSPLLAKRLRSARHALVASSMLTAAIAISTATDADASPNQTVTALSRACSSETVEDDSRESFDPQYLFEEGMSCGGLLRVGDAQNTYQRQIGRDSDCPEMVANIAIDKTALKFDTSSLDPFAEILNAAVSTHGVPAEVEELPGAGARYTDNGLQKFNLGSSLSKGTIVDRWIAGADEDLTLSNPEYHPGYCEEATPFDHRGVIDGPADTIAANRPSLQVTYAPKTGARPLYPLDARSMGSGVDVRVNAATGNLIVSQTATGLPHMAGPDIALGQSYNSLSTDEGALGARWTADSAPDVRLEKFRGNEDVALHDRTGIVAGLDKVRGAGTTDDARRTTEFEEPYWLHADLSSTAGGGYELRNQTGGGKRTFNASGQLVGEADGAGRQITYEYDSSGKPTKIHDADGRHLAVSYTNSKLASIKQVDAANNTLAGGKRWDWSYDASGRLAQFADDAGTTTYGYNSSGRLASVSAPGAKSLTVSYDSAGRASEIAITSGGVTASTTYSYGTGKAIATPSSGAPAIYYFDARDKHYAPDMTAPSLLIEAPSAALFTPGVAPFSVPFSATDDRSGVQGVTASVGGGSPLATQAGTGCFTSSQIPGWESATGVSIDCDRELKGTLSIPTSGLPEGRNTVTIGATDGAALTAPGNNAQIAIDRSAPTLTIGGTLYTQRATTIQANETRTLTIAASDGVPGGLPSEQRSGVAWIGVMIDGEYVTTTANPEAGHDSQGLTLNWSIDADPALSQTSNGNQGTPLDDSEPTSPDPYDPPEQVDTDADDYVTPGDGTVYLDDSAHTITVVSWDWLGNAATSTFDTGPTYINGQD